MKITLGGKAGSGKSVIGKILAEEYSLKHYSSGDLMREIAMKKGHTVEDWSNITPEDVDRYVDDRTKEIGQNEDEFIFDGRLPFHFIPDALKIFLDVTDEEGAKRIFKNQRASEGKAESSEELALRNAERWETDRQRYIKLYNVDIEDQKNYDIYIDTTGKSLEDVITEVRRAIQTLREA